MNPTCEFQSILESKIKQFKGSDESQYCPIDQNDMRNAEKFNALISNEEIETPLIEITSEGEIIFGWKDKKLSLVIDIGFLNGGFSYYAKDKNQHVYLKDGPQYDESSILSLISLLKNGAI